MTKIQDFYGENFYAVYDSQTDDQISEPMSHVEAWRYVRDMLAEGYTTDSIYIATIEKKES